MIWGICQLKDTKSFQGFCGKQDVCSAAGRRALKDRAIQWEGSILSEAASFQNLLKAWRKLKGRLLQTDKLSFELNLEDNLLEISDNLKEGSYFPNPSPVSYHISPSGKKIPIPCLKDRLVALAIKQALLPFLEPSFIYDTYAGLASRGVHKAVKRVMDFQARVSHPQYPYSGWILKADIKDFYPSLHHDVLLAQVERRFQDDALVELLSRFFRVWANWSNTPAKGIPLGSALSAFLSNLYLDSFDHFIKDELGFKFYVRYSDDMAFLSVSRLELEFILGKVKRFLEDRLGVYLNEKKTFLKRTGDGLDFLGYRVFYHHLLLRKKNIKKAKRRLSRMMKEYACGTISIPEIKMSLAGWLGYAGFAQSYNFRRRLFADFKLTKSQGNKG